MKSRTAKLVAVPGQCVAGIIVRTACVLLLVSLATSGCGRGGGTSTGSNQKPAEPVNPLAIVLVPQPGDGRIDKDIRRFQEQIRLGRNFDTALERLGWLFVAKGRESFDPGYYKLAEQCAACLEARGGRTPAALLLRGHVLHNLHRFKEAEVIARELVSRRGLPADYGLLGDALMEQGRLTEAIGAYQTMADLKPDLHACLRAAHVRWLKGDLAGAIELMQNAVQAVSPRDADTAAWALTRLAIYRFQSGAIEEANRQCADALALRPDYPPALLLRGRMLVAQNKPQAAIDLLRRAVASVPLPEYQWALAEALEAAGQSSEARLVEAELRRTGAATDPRTFSLFLATRGEVPQLALHLAQTELENRGDVFTHDALAWASVSAGRVMEARSQLMQALSEGTRDARLFFHAAVITGKAGEPAEASMWFNKALALQDLLLPSEREQLLRLPATAGVHFPLQSIEFAGSQK